MILLSLLNVFVISLSDLFVFVRSSGNLWISVLTLQRYAYISGIFLLYVIVSTEAMMSIIETFRGAPVKFKLSDDRDSFTVVTSLNRFTSSLNFNWNRFWFFFFSSVFNFFNLFFIMNFILRFIEISLRNLLKVRFIPTLWLFGNGNGDRKLWIILKYLKNLKLTITYRMNSIPETICNTKIKRSGRCYPNM